MRENVFVEKSKDFAVRVVRLYKYLTETKKENVMSKQLLRAGTSIGANVAEAQCACSRKDFLSKMYIAFKECNETLYWLELLARTEYLNGEEYTSIKTDAVALKKLLSSITKTTTDSN